ncbi:MAG TPA: cytidine deaminase [Fimbriimonadaceae bacterium]|nr:cytidine deaminase [Fimbriimonadaceae bacterium]
MDVAAKDRLIALANEARTNAYAPYSVYRVGAAVLCEDGRVFSGCNVENVVYGLSVCAERTAIGNMVSAGGLRLSAVAVVTADGGRPCGACRQVLAEFATGPDVPVYCAAEDGEVFESSVGALLPEPFASGDVRRG